MLLPSHRRHSWICSYFELYSGLTSLASYSSAYTVRNPFLESLMRNSLAGVTSTYLRSFCTLVSTLPARPSCDLPLVVFRVFRACALLQPKSGALPIMMAPAWKCLPQSLRLNVLSLPPLPSRKRIKTFVLSGPNDFETCHDNSPYYSLRLNSKEKLCIYF